MKVAIRAMPWSSESAPRKILVMRFQALGDTIITLPYLQSLKRQYPQVELHFLTRAEVRSIPEGINLFDKTIIIEGGRNLKLQLFFVLLKLPWLWLQHYDAVIDLQNHKLSRLVRKLVFKKSWTEFDRYSPLSAGDRTKNTIEALWSWKISIDPAFKIATSLPTDQLLNTNGRMHEHDLVVLNPAGYCASRNWPLENYVAFANRWRETINSKTQFVLLLLPAHQEKANYIKSALGTYCIDLTDQADQLQAFSIIHQCTFVLSEDSGLMHMAWIQGIPTLAVFSSSRKDWSAPQGEWSYCFDSADMACGPCTLEICKFGDNRCITRYSPNRLVDQAQHLLSKTPSKNNNV